MLYYSRFKILKDQLEISIAEYKLLLEDYNKLEKELVSLRETLQDKNKELEKLQISVAENKLLLGDYNKLEKELMSLRKILQDKNIELEKYYTKLVYIALLCNLINTHVMLNCMKIKCIDVCLYT